MEVFVPGWSHWPDLSADEISSMHLQGADKTARSASVGFVSSLPARNELCLTERLQHAECAACRRLTQDGVGVLACSRCGFKRVRVHRPRGCWTRPARPRDSRTRESRVLRLVKEPGGADD